MTIGELMAEWVGEWRGQNQLWFMPDDPPFTSETGMSVTPAAGGVATLLQYTWSHEGTPHAGAMIVLHKATRDDQDAVTWVDSFHTGGGFMHFRGGLVEGAVSVLGAYAAPEGPPWGWRITLAPETGGECLLRMYNIKPMGEESLAVEARFRRQPGA